MSNNKLRKENQRLRDRLEYAEKLLWQVARSGTTIPHSPFGPSKLRLKIEHFVGHESKYNALDYLDPEDLFTESEQSA